MPFFDFVLRRKPVERKAVAEPAFVAAEVARMLVSSFDNQRAAWSDWKIGKAVQEGYKSSTIAYTCIRKLAENTAQPAWQAYRRDPDNPDNWIAAMPDDPLQQLIDRPNPFWSWQRMIEFLSMHLDLGGNGIWYKVRAGQPKMVKELWCLPPDTIAPVKDRMKYLTGYEQRLDYGDTRMLPTADVVHFMLSDPANEWWGISPLLAGAKAVDTDRAAVDWNKIAADNRGVPDGVFNFKTTLTEDQWAANRQVIKDSYLGRENARLPMIFSVPELDFQSLANTMVEMDFLAGRKFTAVEICMLFGVPPAVAGLFQAGAAQAEVANAREVFWLDTIIPRLVRIREVLNRLLVPEFGADASLDFDISNVDALNGPFSRKVLTAGQLFNMGYPANVVNNRLGMGMPPIPGGDQGYMPANYIPTIPGADGEGGGGTA